MRDGAFRDYGDSPLAIPRPERARRWRRILSYRKVERIRRPVVDLVCYRIPARLPAAAGLRLAFASDFHFSGTREDLTIAEQAAERIAEFRPDLLLLGGDLSSEADRLERLPELLELFRRTAPVRLAVSGNWESGKEWLSNDFWRKLYEDAGIRFLCNEFHIDSRISVYGCDELATGTPRLPRTWPEGRFHLLLVHRPDTVIALDHNNALAPVELALTGHTHGGQVRFPGIGPVFASSRYGCKFAYGEFLRRETGVRMIVSGGVGHRSFPFRFRCRREVLGIELVQS